MGPFHVKSTIASAYYLDTPLNMVTVHLYFHTSLLKPVGSQPAGPPALEDDSYEVKAILQINICGTYAKVK